MQRRTVLAAIPASVLLGGCGYELRRTPDFAFRSMYAGFLATSPLGLELRRTMESGSDVRVLFDPRQRDQAQVLLEVLTDQREKIVVGLNVSGQVREFQLRTRLKFRLRGRDGKELIGDTEILQQRDLSYNETAALAKEAEEALLYRDMQSDIVMQLMRRLAAVRSL